MTDPSRPVGRSFEQRTAQRLGDLERRVAQQERAPLAVTVGTGAPTDAAGDGALRATTAPALYLRIGGAWRWVALS